MKIKKLVLAKCLAAVVVGGIAFSSCEVEEDPIIPTKSSMEGVWVVTEGYAESGDTITSQIQFPITAYHLSSDNTVISTAGPMWMYIVYGDSKFVQIASSIDQVFSYTGIDFNGGEFFVGGGEQERFTIEVKLEGLPGQKALTTLLDLIGITQDKWDVVVYHKFRNVKVDFADDYNTMIWEWDDITTATYNTKDNFGDYVLWDGWPIDSFNKSRFVLRKQTRDVQTVVKDCVAGNC